MSGKQETSPKITLLVMCDMNNFIDTTNDPRWKVPEFEDHVRKIFGGSDPVIIQRDAVNEEGPFVDDTKYAVLNIRKYGGPWWGTFEEIQKELQTTERKRIFVYGDLSIYRTFFPFAHEIFMTRCLFHASGCKVKFPPILSTEWEIPSVYTSPVVCSKSGLRYKESEFVRTHGGKDYFAPRN